MSILGITIGVFALSGLPVLAQDNTADGPILITNVDVFDGVNEALLEDVNVVVTGNTITEISADDLAVAGGRVIDGEGYTLMPGIIDAHGHFPGSGLTEVSANLNSPPIGPVQSIPQLQQALQAWVAHCLEQFPAS